MALKKIPVIIIMSFEKISSENYFYYFVLLGGSRFEYNQGIPKSGRNFFEWKF